MNNNSIESRFYTLNLFKEDSKRYMELIFFFYVTTYN